MRKCGIAVNRRSDGAGSRSRQTPARSLKTLRVCLLQCGRHHIAEYPVPGEFAGRNIALISHYAVVPELITT